MLSTRLIVGAALVAFGTAGMAATKPAPKGAAATKPATPKRLTGKQETLACRLGTEDRHARIAVVVVRGKTDSFAYYSKWKPRTCSVYLQRKGDMYSKWADNGNITTVNLEKGAFLIEHKPGEYHFIFRDIDRERYCGMDGVINGSLTIKRGSDQCVLDGEIMVEGTPLGQAFANREEDKAPVGLLPVTPQEAAKAPPDRSPPAGEVAPEKAAEPQAKPATPPAAPAAETAPAPAAPAETAADSPAKPADASAATAAKPAATTAAAPASTAAKPEPAKSAEPASTSPFRSFFRSLSESKGPETSGGQ
jgi:hypothetical protein